MRPPGNGAATPKPGGVGELELYQEKRYDHLRQIIMLQPSWNGATNTGTGRCSIKNKGESCTGATERDNKTDMRIERESWRIIEFILRRYPDKKKEYEEYINDGCQGTGIGSKIVNAYMERSRKEIEAIETVYNSLNKEEQKVMRERYWTDRRRNTPYLKMTQNSYSERQRKRIVHKIIYRVGEELGEIMRCEIATSQGLKIGSCSQK